MTPQVSVVMPVYNGEKYLARAIESILCQTFSDFEFIILDDASTDSSTKIIDDYHDSRIKLIRNERNLGVPIRLNQGVDLARGKYIARMDCDDISLPERLQRQVAAMDAHPEVSVCGTWASDIDETDHVMRLHKVPFGKFLKLFYWRPSPIIHPAAMINAAHLQYYRYDPQMRDAEDYDLWLRLKAARHELYNLTEQLLLYRVHPGSVSNVRQENQSRKTFESFCRHVTCHISHQAFLALNFDSFQLHPIRRMRAMHQVSHALRQSYGYLHFRDDMRYLYKWIKACKHR